MLSVAWLLLGSQAAQGQGGGGGGGQGGGGGGGQGGGGNAGVGGVFIDARGILSIKVFRDPTRALTRARQAAAKAMLSADVLKDSQLRKISINRLEAAMAGIKARGEIELIEMKYLAGLTRITHVFFYEETGDIVIAGPAEGFYEDISGRAVGITSGHAVLELQDLIAALRAYSPDGRRENVISVSIDPTQEGLQRMNQFLSRVSPQQAIANPRLLAQQLKQNLGLQKVTVKGIPPKSHFAQVLVEADYRMKLIGIGLEQPPVRITTYISKASPRGVARNAMQRWYFTPNYDCVMVSDDGNAMHMTGDGVKLVSEHEMVSGDGKRIASGKFDKASQQFVQSFTRMYPQLAARAPVYAQLRNLMDLSIAAAYIQQQDFYGRAGWTMDLFGSEENFPIATYPVPATVDSAVNVVFKGNTLMTPIGGGVNIQPRQAIRRDRVQKDTDGMLQEAHSRISLDHLQAGQWWWD
jgi:hypothetical protein